MTPRSRVAVVRTSPQTVLQDYSRLMDIAGIREALPVGPEVSLRINISWHVYMPACSTTPWQLDAVIAKLLETGHAREKIYAAQNRTVVVDCRVGAVNNNLQPVLDREHIEIQYLNEKPTASRIKSSSSGQRLRIGAVQFVYVLSRTMALKLLTRPRFG